MDQESLTETGILGYTRI